MHNFQYHRASSLNEAAGKIEAATDGTLMAGGMTLLPTLKLRLASPSDVVDIGGIAELSGIKMDGGAVVIGAMTTHAEVVGSAVVQRKISALAALAGGIGDPQVRHRGTIGGSVANNDPAADYPAACLALGATIKTNRREIAADDFFVGLFETALDEGEIITEVRFPVPEKAAYEKFPNPASRYALVGVFVAKGGDGTRVAVTGAGQDGVFRIAAMEEALAANFSPDAVAGVGVGADGLNSDMHASSEYRAHLIGVMAQRAVAACG